MLNNASQVHAFEKSSCRDEDLSALMDGHSDSEETLDDLLRQMKTEADAMSQWSMYHLIGDVLRSSDLACPPESTALLSFRERLSKEPVILAPQSMPTSLGVPSRHLKWRGTAWAIAGVFVASGALWVARPWDKEGSSNPSSMPLVAVSPASQAQVVNTDELQQVNEYIAAHQEFQAATALGRSTGFIRASLGPTSDTEH